MREAWERFVQVAYSEGYISESVRDTCLKVIEVVWEKGITRRKEIES